MTDERPDPDWPRRSEAPAETGPQPWRGFPLPEDGTTGQFASGDPETGGPLPGPGDGSGPARGLFEAPKRPLPPVPGDGTGPLPPLPPGQASSPSPFAPGPLPARGAESLPGRESLPPRGPEAALPRRGPESTPPRGVDPLLQRTVQALSQHLDEPGPARGQDAFAPRPAETLPAREEPLAQRGPESRRPRGPDLLAQRGPESASPYDLDPLPQRAPESLPPGGAESFAQRGPELPQRGEDSFPQRGPELPQRGADSFPQRGPDPFPQRGPELPQRGADPFPQRGPESLPQRGPEPMPQRGGGGLPQRGAEPLPQRGGGASPGGEPLPARNGALPRRTGRSRPAGRHRSPHRLSVASDAPALILAVPGSAGGRHLRAVEEITAIAENSCPGVEIRVGFLDGDSYTLREALSFDGPPAGGHTLNGVVVPLLAGPHPALDDALAEAASRTSAQVMMGAHLGPHPLIAEALHARLAEAGLARESRTRGLSFSTATYGVVVLADRGEEAVKNAGVAAVLLASRLAMPAAPASIDNRASVEAALARLREAGAERPVIAPCLIGPETPDGDLERVSAAIGAPVSAPLGGHPAIGQLVAIRYGAALARLSMAG